MPANPAGRLGSRLRLWLMAALAAFAGGSGMAAGEGAPFPTPGRWSGSFSNEFGEKGDLSLTLERNGNAWSGTGFSTGNDGSKSPRMTFIDGRRTGNDFTLTGRMPIPLEGDAPVPGAIVLTGVAEGSVWKGTFRITIDGNAGFSVNGRFNLSRDRSGQSIAHIQDLDAYKIDFALREIRDPQMNNELAVTVAVPNGWRFKDPNVVQWTPMLYGDPARIFYTLVGPEDEATCQFLSKQSFRYDFGIERLFAMTKQQQAQQIRQLEAIARQTGVPLPPLGDSPPEYRENTIDDGHIVKKPLSPELFILDLLAQDKTISRLQVTKTWKPEPIVEGLKKMLPEFNRQIAATVPPGGAAGQATADTAVVEFTCFKDGKQYEQQTAVVIVYMRLPSPTNVVTGAADTVVYWTASPAVAVYALKGKLKDHEREVATIMANSLVNPVWTAKVDYLVAQTIRAINERRIKTQGEIQRTMNETFDHISKTRQEVFQNRQNTMSRVAQGMTDVITGTDRVLGDDGKIYAVPVGTFPDRKVPWAF